MLPCAAPLRTGPEALPPDDGAAAEEDCGAICEDGCAITDAEDEAGALLLDMDDVDDDPLRLEDIKRDEDETAALLEDESKADALEDPPLPLELMACMAPLDDADNGEPASLASLTGTAVHAAAETTSRAEEMGRSMRPALTYGSSAAQNAELRGSL